MDILISIIAFIFVIGVMVLVHEWGHYIAAKKIGVAVEAFSIGFGPKLFGWKRGETEYKISALPIGGYVKMLAENPDEGATGDPREFQSRKRWERFIILFMGPLLNILLAYLIWVGIFMIGEQKEVWLTQPPVVEYVTPDSPAQKAGLITGDKVLAVNGTPMRTWEQFIYQVATSPRETITLTVERGGRQVELTAEPSEDPTSGIGSIGVAPIYPPVIEGIAADMPAARAGLQEGDIVVSIDGAPVNSYYDVYDTVTNYTEGAPALVLGITRGAETLQIPVTPVYDMGVSAWRIGISRPAMPKAAVSPGFFESFGAAAGRCVEMTANLYDVLVKMLSGKLSSKAISGPLEIAAISGRTAEQGLLPLLNLMAFISLNLGIVNLLPLPVLDGGQITILGIEGALRRDLSVKVKDWIMRVGVALLMLLMVFVVYQDIGKMISRMG